MKNVCLRTSKKSEEKKAMMFEPHENLWKTFWLSSSPISIHLSLVINTNKTGNA